MSYTQVLTNVNDCSSWAPISFANWQNPQVLCKLSVVFRDEESLDPTGEPWRTCPNCQIEGLLGFALAQECREQGLDPRSAYRCAIVEMPSRQKLVHLWGCPTHAWITNLFKPSERFEGKAVGEAVRAAWRGDDGKTEVTYRAATLSALARGWNSFLDVAEDQEGVFGRVWSYVAEEEFVSVLKWVLAVPLSIVLRNPWPTMPSGCLNAVGAFLRETEGSADHGALTEIEAFDILAPLSLRNRLRFPVDSGSKREQESLVAAVAWSQLKRLAPPLRGGDLSTAYAKHAETVGKPRPEPTPVHLGFVREICRSLFRRRKWRVRGATFSESSCTKKSRSKGGARGTLQKPPMDTETRTLRVGQLHETDVPFSCGPYYTSDHHWESLLRDTVGVSSCRAIAVPAPLKARVITIMDPACNFFKNLQVLMWRRLANHPVWQFTAGMPTPEGMSHIYSLPGIINSVDYSCATDGIPTQTSLTALDTIMSRLGRPVDLDPTEWEAYKKAARDSLTGCVIEYPEGMGPPIQQQGGQLMGHLLSFPILCIVNFAIWMEWAVEEGLYTSQQILHSLEVGEDLPLRINGDDLKFNECGANGKRFAEIVARCGWQLSVGKSYRHEYVGSLNSMYFMRHDEPVAQWVEESVSLASDEKTPRGLPRFFTDPSSGLKYPAVRPTLVASKWKWGGCVEEEGKEWCDSLAGFLGRLSPGEVMRYCSLYKKQIEDLIPGHPFLPKTLGGGHILRDFPSDFQRIMAIRRGIKAKDVAAQWLVEEVVRRNRLTDESRASVHGGFSRAFCAVHLDPSTNPALRVPFRSEKALRMLRCGMEQGLSEDSDLREFVPTLLENRLSCWDRRSGAILRLPAHRELDEHYRAYESVWRRSRLKVEVYRDKGGGAHVFDQVRTKAELVCEADKTRLRLRLEDEGLFESQRAPTQWTGPEQRTRFPSMATCAKLRGKAYTVAEEGQGLYGPENRQEFVPPNVIALTESLPDGYQSDDEGVVL